MILEELVKNKVCYKVFDKAYSYPIYNYNIPNFKDQVKDNIKRVVKIFCADNILLLNQVHGNNVIDADNTEVDFDNWPKADASVTTQKNLVLSIHTADCVPVLLSSDDGKVIGAVHAGWRSAKSDVIDKAAKLMKQKGATDISCFIGPSIAQESYEVSRDYYQGFIACSNSYDVFFIPSIKPNHYMFDLPAFVKMKLEEANIHVVKHINENTYAMADKYPSFRRSTHKDEMDDQRILSAIMIK